MKKIHEAYLKLTTAAAELPDGPKCADPLFAPMFFSEPATLDHKLNPRVAQEQHKADEENAKILCHFCPVKALCLDYALTAREEFGVWGGTSVSDRRAIWSFAKGNKPEEPVGE